VAGGGGGEKVKADPNISLTPSRKKIPNVAQPPLTRMKKLSIRGNLKKARRKRDTLKGGGGDWEGQF